MEDDLFGRQPQWKTTSIEDDPNSSNQLEINKTYNLTIVGPEERKPYFAIWKDERQPPWKMISMEDDLRKLKGVENLQNLLSYNCKFTLMEFKVILENRE